MRSHVFTFLCVLSLGAACHPRPKAATHPPWLVPLGSREDFKTPLGQHDGFYLRAQCRSPDCFVVEGQGSRWYPGLEREAEAGPLSVRRLRPGYEHFRAELLATLDGLSIWGTGFGLECDDTTIGMDVRTNDWRRLDEIIARLGTLLQREDLREPVIVCVGEMNVHR